MTVPFLRETPEWTLSFSREKESIHSAISLQKRVFVVLYVFNKAKHFWLMSTNFKNKKFVDSNVLPLHPKQTFPPVIWIFTGIKSRLTFKIFSTLFKSLKNTLKKLNFRMGLLILDHCACLLLRNRFDFEFELSRPQGLVKWQKVICASWFLVLFLFCLFLTIMFLFYFSWSLLSFFKSFLLQNGWQTEVAVAFGLLGHLILVRVNTLLYFSKTSSLKSTQ